MDQLLPALIIARQEQLRNSLQVLLASLSRIGPVELANAVPTNLDGKEHAGLALVLLALDSSYTDVEILQTLRQLKSTWPAARTAVLVEDERQYQAVQAAGANLVVFKGIFAAEILKKIELLLPSVDP
jgi:DNA-binding NarL/FixJ family response regulator